MQNRKISELETTHDLPITSECMFPIYTCINGNPGEPVSKISLKGLVSAIKKHLDKDCYIVISNDENSVLFFDVKNDEY